MCQKRCAALWKSKFGCPGWTAKRYPVRRIGFKAPFTQFAVQFPRVAFTRPPKGTAMSAFRIALFAAACSLAAAGDAAAHKVVVHRAHRVASAPHSVVVAMDNVAVVSLKGPATQVYIGNPSIAEITVIDQRHMFVLGKRPGGTNLLALDAGGRVVANEPVTVSNTHPGGVTVYRGSDTFNYICTDHHCETRPVPGDPDAFFENTEKPAKDHEETGNKAADLGGAAVQGGR
jgi:hypothetical protein